MMRRPPRSTRSSPLCPDTTLCRSHTTVRGVDVLRGGEVVESGDRQTMQLLEARIETARQSMGEELAAFAENTLSYLSQERHLLLDEPDIPDIDLDMQIGRANV